LVVRLGEVVKVEGAALFRVEIETRSAFVIVEPVLLRAGREQIRTHIGSGMYCIKWVAGTANARCGIIALGNTHSKLDVQFGV
jgi:hypothetical protein